MLTFLLIFVRNKNKNDMYTYKIESFRNEVLGTEKHLIIKTETINGKKYTSTEFESNDLNRVKSKLRMWKSLKL